ncbi:MAG: acyl carrier protein [Chlorobium limicola]|uniref:acyl carrier protein n=1 Tax=Chlorobium limicola TaxID=1092 RepID=UPI0023F4EA84|nr:acyl carrier protein [Chlorobium limicola]MBM3163806.1 acyl carrier protein [Chlorobiota bacterium]NTV20926.1 acyl carrier protein [Chlorobium limicola]
MPSLTGSEIRDQLLGYLNDSFPLFIPDAPDDTPMADHGIDSLGMTNIVVQLEQQFGIEVEDAEITRANLGSVQSLVNFIGKKLNA